MKSLLQTSDVRRNNFLKYIAALNLVFHPSKAQIAKDIPKAMKEMTVLMNEFKLKTGADDRYVSMMLGALMSEYTHKARSAQSAWE